MLRRDPFTGTVFVFRAKRADRLKLIFWDGTGLVMIYKRLEKQGFAWPAVRDGTMHLDHAQPAGVDHGVDLRRQSASGTTHATIRTPLFEPAACW